MLWEWMAYENIEPFGDNRGDLRAGIIASTIANANRNPKRRRRAFSAEDFMPKFGRPREQTWQEGLAIVETMAAEYGWQDNRTDEQKDWRQYH